MSPDLISFAFRALLRLGNAGSSALAQYARDRDAVFPDLKKPTPDMTTFVAGFFAQANRAHFVAANTGPYAEFWSPTGPDASNPFAVDALYIAIVKIRAEEGVDIATALSADSEIAAGLVMIEQWSDKNEPVGPLARVLVTVADIALEYVATNPSIAGLDGRGEKLLGAFAQSLSTILPDDGNLGPKQRFAERLFAVALRAGLETIAGNTDILVDEAHVRDLLDKSLMPVIESLPDDIVEQLDFKRTLEAISGPALSAALGTISKYPEAFLGNSFAGTTAIGAVTQAVLKEASNSDFAEIFERDGLERIYKAALGVAATRPELFVASANGNADDIARQLIAKFATVLRQNNDADDRGVAPLLGAAILEVVQANVHLYLNTDQPWESLAADLLESILTGLKSGVVAGADDPLKSVFSREQLVGLARIVLTQVAATPSMIANGNAEVTRLVGLIASLVAADEDLLLTSDDWHAIAVTIVAEAAANPGRLFDLDGSQPNEKLAEELIKLVLKAASESMRSAGRAGGATLFGETLREAIIILIAATAGNSAAAREHLPEIEGILTKLTSFVADNRERFGSREWLALFEHLLIDALSGESVAELTIELATTILEGGEA